MKNGNRAGAYRRNDGCIDQCCIEIERAARAMGVWGRSPQEKDAAAVRAWCECCACGGRETCASSGASIVVLCVRRMYDALRVNIVFIEIVTEPVCVWTHRRPPPAEQAVRSSLTSDCASQSAF